jgi:hypothetical protein
MSLKSRLLFLSTLLLAASEVTCPNGGKKDLTTQEKDQANRYAMYQPATETNIPGYIPLRVKKQNLRTEDHATIYPPNEAPRSQLPRNVPDYTPLRYKAGGDLPRVHGYSKFKPETYTPLRRLPDGKTAERTTDFEGAPTDAQYREWLAQRDLAEQAKNQPYTRMNLDRLDGIEELRKMKLEGREEAPHINGPITRGSKAFRDRLREFATLGDFLAASPEQKANIQLQWMESKADLFSFFLSNQVGHLFVPYIELIRAAATYLDAKPGDTDWANKIQTLHEAMIQLADHYYDIQGQKTYYLYDKERLGAVSDAVNALASDTNNCKSPSKDVRCGLRQKIVVLQAAIMVIHTENHAFDPIDDKVDTGKTYLLYELGGQFYNKPSISLFRFVREFKIYVYLLKISIDMSLYFGKHQYLTPILTIQSKLQQAAAKCKIHYSRSGVHLSMIYNCSGHELSEFIRELRAFESALAASCPNDTGVNAYICSRIKAKITVIKDGFESGFAATTDAETIQIDAEHEKEVMEFLSTKIKFSNRAIVSSNVSTRSAVITRAVRIRIRDVYSKRSFIHDYFLNSSLYITIRLCYRSLFYYFVDLKTEQDIIEWFWTFDTLLEALGKNCREGTKDFIYNNKGISELSSHLDLFFSKIAPTLTSGALADEVISSIRDLQGRITTISKTRFKEPIVTTNVEELGALPDINPQKATTEVPKEDTTGITLQENKGEKEGGRRKKKMDVEEDGEGEDQSGQPSDQQVKDYLEQIANNPLYKDLLTKQGGIDVEVHHYHKDGEGDKKKPQTSPQTDLLGALTGKGLDFIKTRYQVRPNIGHQGEDKTLRIGDKDVIPNTQKGGKKGSDQEEDETDTFLVPTGVDEEMGILGVFDKEREGHGDSKSKGGKGGKKPQGPQSMVIKKKKYSPREEGGATVEEDVDVEEEEVEIEVNPSDIQIGGVPEDKTVGGDRRKPKKPTTDQMTIIKKKFKGGYQPGSEEDPENLALKVPTQTVTEKEEQGLPQGGRPEEKLPPGRGEPQITVTEVEEEDTSLEAELGQSGKDSTVPGSKKKNVIPGKRGVINKKKPIGENEPETDVNTGGEGQAPTDLLEAGVKKKLIDLMDLDFEDFGKAFTPSKRDRQKKVVRNTFINPDKGRLPSRKGGKPGVRGQGEQPADVETRMPTEQQVDTLEDIASNLSKLPSTDLDKQVKPTTQKEPIDVTGEEQPGLQTPGKKTGDTPNISKIPGQQKDIDEEADLIGTNGGVPLTTITEEKPVTKPGQKIPLVPGIDEDLQRKIRSEIEGAFKGDSKVKSRAKVVIKPKLLPRAKRGDVDGTGETPEGQKQPTGEDVQPGKTTQPDLRDVLNISPPQEEDQPLGQTVPEVKQGPADKTPVTKKPDTQEPSEFSTVEPEESEEIDLPPKKILPPKTFPKDINSEDFKSTFNPNSGTGLKKKVNRRAVFIRPEEKDPVKTTQPTDKETTSDVQQLPPGEHREQQTEPQPIDQTGKLGGKETPQNLQGTPDLRDVLNINVPDRSVIEETENPDTTTIVPGKVNPVEEEEEEDQGKKVQPTDIDTKIPSGKTPPKTKKPVPHTGKTTFNIKKKKVIKGQDLTEGDSDLPSGTTTEESKKEQFQPLDKPIIPPLMIEETGDRDQQIGHDLPIIDTTGKTGDKEQESKIPPIGGEDQTISRGFQPKKKPTDIVPGTGEEERDGTPRDTDEDGSLGRFNPQKRPTDIVDHETDEKTLPATFTPEKKSPVIPPHGEHGDPRRIPEETGEATLPAHFRPKDKPEDITYDPKKLGDLTGHDTGDVTEQPTDIVLPENDPRRKQGGDLPHPHQQKTVDVDEEQPSEDGRPPSKLDNKGGKDKTKPRGKEEDEVEPIQHVGEDIDPETGLLITPVVKPVEKQLLPTDVPEETSRRVVPKKKSSDLPTSEDEEEEEFTARFRAKVKSAKVRHLVMIEYVDCKNCLQDLFFKKAVEAYRKRMALQNKEL